MHTFVFGSPRFYAERALLFGMYARKSKGTKTLLRCVLQQRSQIAYLYAELESPDLASKLLASTKSSSSFTEAIGDGF